MYKIEKYFGKRLKEIRKSNNMSQAMLAEKLGVDEKYISRLETGTSTPSFSMIVKLSDTFKIETESLFKFQHLKNKEELLKIINYKISIANEDKLRLLYKIIEYIL